MNQISKEALEFVEEAKNGFIENGELTTYRNKDANFIALRGGFRDDCMTIYELGDPVGNFVQQLPSQHKVLVDYDEYEKLKKIDSIRKFASEGAERSMEAIDSGSCRDYNIGYNNAMEHILNFIIRKGI